MAFGSDKFYLVVFFISLVVLGTYGFGNELRSSGANLDNESINYLNNFTGQVDSSGLGIFTDEDQRENLKLDDVILDPEETEGQSQTDFLANLNYYKEKVGKFFTFVIVIYNLPALLLFMLRLPIDPFSIYTTAVVTILYVAVVMYFVKKVRGS